MQTQSDPSLAPQALRRWIMLLKVPFQRLPQAGRLPVHPFDTATTPSTLPDQQEHRPEPDSHLGKR
jgi:hypothetical protein